MTMSNGSLLSITNVGSAGAGDNVGGSTVFPLGEGSLTVAGGSRVSAGLRVHKGWPQQRGLRAGALQQLDRARRRAALYVGRLTGSDGIVIVSGVSSVTAGYVGIGRSRARGGGTGTMIVNGSTLTATTIEVGANGYLGGNGTIVGSIRTTGS